MLLSNILSRCVILSLFTLFIANSSQTLIENENTISSLQYCREDKTHSIHKRIILVSTLDGKISALNQDDGGLESWNVATGPGGMLSSSIHRLELTNNGQWVRMIPSLSGGLYKFNGDFIEAIPITADNLLRSSFKYSDDLVISGGRESRTYGIELESGRVLYECSLGGCDNYTELDSAGDVVLVQRQTQTVRAVEPRTGIERWNFSVGQHEVKVSPGPLIDCLEDQGSLPDTIIKVIVPEGLVCAFSTSQPGRILWTHKFDFPVVNAWKINKGQLHEIDLFGGTHPPSGPDQEGIPLSPALYVGMHEKQLYIQESVRMQQKIQELTENFHHHLLTDNRKAPQIPWNPVLASSSSTAVGLPSSTSPGKASETSEAAEDGGKHSHVQTTAMSVLYASEYVNGNGFYLYNQFETQPDTVEDATLCPVNNSLDNFTDEEIPVVQSPDDIHYTHNQIFVVSLWFWWKEVFLISITTAILVNILMRRRLDQTFSYNSSQFDKVKESLKSLRSQDLMNSNISLPLQRSSESFESRFLTDFIPVHCLGKGGFGVVFEAKNKIDDCHYAIKRIPLPNSDESRERVMREVKALAKLDHQNIVRYFNAWLECPPSGWQEIQDQLWISNRDCFSSNGGAFTVDLTGQVTPESEKSFGHVINRNKLMLRPKALWQPSLGGASESTSMPPKTQLMEEDNDSFIVFQTHSKERSETVSENNNDIKEIEVEDSRLDSAITMTSDTSMDTNTDVMDITKSESVKRPNKLAINKSEQPADSSRMYLFIQMQLCKKKSLKDWLKDNIHNRSKPDVISIFDQIVQAVEYVHTQGLIHRDLKPSNIFFSPDGQVKVGDFGLVTAMAESPVDIWVSVEAELDGLADEKHTARVGTQLYMSPEQVSGKPYSYKVDIYSLGVILFELLIPFNTQMERIHSLTNLRANKYPKDFQAMFPLEYELLKLMLSHHPDERPTTYGIRARPPLDSVSPNASSSLVEWHFDLPKRLSSSKSSSQSNSLES